MRQFLFVLAVFLFGAFVSYAIAAGMLGMDFDSANGEFFVFAAVLLGGIPALLSAIPPRGALILLGAIAALLGIWGASVASMPGDGAIGGFLLLLFTFVFVLYGLAIIGLRKFIIKKSAAQNDL